jgi:hypothetical protein
MTFIKSLVDLGGTVVISALILFVLYKLSMKFGVAFITAQNSIAEAMTRQADTLSGVHKAIETYIQKDNREHREILLGVQVLAEEFKMLRADIRRERDERG